jgi:dsDNA-specific endonuclease/ATPase MutS2
MQPGVLRALEFERIIEAVRSFALTPLGDESLGRLAPSTDPHTVAQLLASTSETTRYLTHNALFPLRASSDLPQILAALAVEGRALEAQRLLTFAAFLDSIDEDMRKRVLDIFAKDLKDTAIVHIGRAEAGDPIFVRVLHLVKDPTIRRLVRHKAADVPATAHGMRGVMGS